MGSSDNGSVDSDESNHEVTQLLIRWQAGEENAYQQLIPLIYENLRRIAGGVAASQFHSEQTQATAIVHELYLKLVDTSSRNFNNRSHFFSAAARAMRQILIDRGRRDAASKRGGAMQRVEWNDAVAGQVQTHGELIELNDALEDLEQKDRELAVLIDLRHFAGMSVDEIAEIQQISADTIRRRLRLAEAWLGSYLGKDNLS